MEPNIFVTLIVSLIGSSAVFTFIQFWVTRHDQKADRFAKLENDLKSIKDHLQTDIAEIYNKIDSLANRFEETNASNARTRILRASDEIRHGAEHSKEFYDQLSDDITYYEQYCRNHPRFKNNRAVQAIESINEIYLEKLKTNDFLK